MPRIDSDLVQVWDDLYSAYKEDGTLGHFERALMSRYYGRDGDKLRQVLGLQPGQRIALIGCGFGWLVEQWTDAGLTVIGTDTSAWVQANKSTQSRSDIAAKVLNESCTTAASRSAVKQALGVTGNNKLDWVITEDVLPILDDSECLQVGTALRSIAVNVAHWVSVGTRKFDDATVWTGDARLNWKTLAAWKALMTPDTVVQRQGGAVL